MKAVVVYESLWGNTAAIGRAVAEGLGEGARALSTREATADALADVDLVVAGAPLLGFSLPTEQMREQIRTSPPGGPAPDLSAPSMRSWLDSVPEGRARCATYETRIWWSPGSSAKTIADCLGTKGYELLAAPEKFVVTGKTGPLKNGETDRARAWGASLAASLGPVGA